MRVFISHRELDAELAKALIDVLQIGLLIDSDQIVCSSVAGHKLKFGRTIEQQIREEIASTPVLFALLTQRALQSSWVTFELGAAWGMDVLTIALLGPGVKYGELPAALGQYPCISAEQSHSDVRASVMQALEQVRERASDSRSVNAAKLSSAVDDFVNAFTTVQTLAEALPEASVSQSADIPDGYALIKTPYGSPLLESTGTLPHYVCTVCWTDHRRKSILIENGPNPTTARCPSCKTVFRFRSDPPLPRVRSASPFTRDW